MPTKTEGPISFDVLYFKNPQGEGEEFSHQYTETWKATEHYCPHCSAQEVWEEDGGGDYYVGTKFLCIICGTTFHLPFYSTDSKDRQHQQRLHHIRKGKK